MREAVARQVVKARPVEEVAVVVVARSQRRGQVAKGAEVMEDCWVGASAVLMVTLACEVAVEIRAVVDHNP